VEKGQRLKADYSRGFSGTSEDVPRYET